MAVTCAELLKLKEFETIELIAGEAGLNNAVSWPYIKQTSHLEQWIYGGELVFVLETEHRITTESLVSLIAECADSHAGGVVVLYGGGSVIQKIPPEVCRKADDRKIPLFQMPFELRLIDVTREISNRIVIAEQVGRKITNFMSELLYDNYLMEEQLAAEGRECGIDLNAPSFFAVFGLKAEKQNTEYSRFEQSNLLRAFTQLAQQKSEEYGAPMLYYHTFHMSICLFQITDEAQRQDLMTIVDTLLSSGERPFAIYCGYSCLHEKCKGIHEGFVEGRHALRLAYNSKNKNVGYRYEDMGILKYLINSAGKQQVLNYCYDVLKELTKADHNDQSDYTNTVYQYIFHNGNLVKTAEALFIHRNTLINRMKKAEKITGKNFDDVQVRNEYYNVFSVLQFYDVKW